MPAPATSVFISYNRADAAVAMSLDSGLKAAGFRTFIDKDRVDGTVDFSLTIYDALRVEVDCVVIILTERAALSRWVRFEMLVAERSGKHVVIYREPTWPTHEYWAAWRLPEVQDIASLIACVKAIRGPAKPKSLRWNLRSYPTPEFVDREAESAIINERLRDRPVPFVVTGLGGLGKTQLVLEYVFQHHADYDLIWWVRASERVTMIADLAALGIELGLPGADEARAAETAEAAVRALSPRSGYLLVFDNAERPDEVLPFVPGGTGHRLVTSRRTDWPWGDPMVLGRLDMASSLAFLQRRTQQPPSPAMELVARRLDGLPLALAQAGAYISQQRISIEEYANRLDRQKSELMKAGTVVESEARIASTWDLSFTQVIAETPDALHVMAACAFLAPEDIPKDLFETQVAALRELSRFSLISLMPATFSVHSLVQDFVRGRLDDERRSLRNALEILTERLPARSIERRAAESFDALVPHVFAATGHADQRNTDARLSMGLLLDAGDHLIRRSMFADARVALERALRMGEAKFGSDSPALAAVLNSLGLVCDFSGDFSGAERAFRRGIGILQSKHGQADLLVQLRRNLAALYQNMNEPARARAILDDAAAESGPRESIASTVSMQEYAQACMAQRNLESAERLFLQVLDKRLKGFYNERQELGQSYADLSQLYMHKQAYADALRFADQAIEVYRTELGEQHLFLAIALFNRVGIYRALGRFDDAVRDLEASRAIIVTTSGSAHPYLSQLLLTRAEIGIERKRPRSEIDGALREAVDICAAHPDVPQLAGIRKRALRLLENGGGLPY